MAKALPFLVVPKTKIRAIGSPEIGVIHLLQKGDISPNENPEDVQQERIRKAKLQLMLQSAIRRLADKERISIGEARRRLFSAPVKSAADGDEAAEVTAVEEDADSLYDNLTPEESTELLTLQEDAGTIAIRAVTLLIQHRVAYPVQTCENVRAKATVLPIIPASFPIPADSTIKFGSTRVKTAEFVDFGYEEIETAQINQPIAVDTIGYLCNEKGQLKIGDPDWTEDDSRALSASLLLAIYEFYQLEEANITEDEAPALEGKDQEPTATNSPKGFSDSSQEGNRSTGKKSSGNSNTSDAETSDLTPKTSETLAVV